MAADLLRERLPAHLSIGVTQDGRIFFVDDRIQTTSWLHPRTGQPVKTGHRSIAGVLGWEEAVTPEGALFYINHNTQETTFEHPVTRKPANHEPHRSGSMSPPRSPSGQNTPQGNRKVATPTKVRIQKAPPAKRENSNMVSMRGWLYRQESGIISWKKRWCVLADFGLFVYKGDEEKTQIGSILLPSLSISPCQSGESSKKYAFKLEHSNIKTCMFASDNQEDMNRWINALKTAAKLRGPNSDKEPNNNGPQKLVPKSAFMEWDEDEESPMNKKFWKEGPNFGPHQDKQQHSPDSRGPYEKQGPRSPQNPSFRNERKSPGSPSAKPKIPLDQNMPKGMTYDPFHGYRQDPRNNQVQEQDKISPRERYNERHRNKENKYRDKDPRQRYPSDESSHRQHFNSRSGVPNDSFNKYASERAQRDSRSRYPEDMDRLRSRSADKYQSSIDPRSSYAEDNTQYGPRDSRSGYSEDSDPQRRSRKRDPTDGLPAIPREQVQRRQYDSDRRQENPRLKSDHLDHYNQHNGHSPRNQGRGDDPGSPYNKRPEQFVRSQAAPQDKSPSRYPDGGLDHHNPPRSPGYDDDRGIYDPFQTHRIYDPFHGYRQAPQSKPQEPEVEYSKINKVKRDPDRQPDENPYMHMNRSGKHPDDYITHDRLQQQINRDGELRNSIREGDNFGMYSPQAETRQREQQFNRQEDPYSHNERSQTHETEQKFLYSHQENVPEDPYLMKHDQHLPSHGQYHQGYWDPEDGYSSLTKYRDNTHNAPQPQHPSHLSHYDPHNDLSQHTYENIHNTHRNLSDSDDIPNRPPLPTSVRQQIVEEIAQTKTPHTSQEILDAERNLEARMQQPVFFNYPTPTLPHSQPHQNAPVDSRYGRPVESKQYHHHRDGYHDNQPYDQGRSKYPGNLPTRGQVEQDLKMLGRPHLNSDPRIQNEGLTKNHSPGRSTAHTTKEPSTDLPKSDSTNHKKPYSSPDIVQSAESSILHPYESDLAKRRLSPQKSLEMPEQEDEDAKREDLSGKLAQQLSAIGIYKSPTYVNVDGEGRTDEIKIDQPSAFRPLSSNKTDSLTERSNGGQRRSRASESERSYHGNEETDVKKRTSVASSHASEQSRHSYNKLTGGPLKHGSKQPPKTLPLIHTVKEDPDMPDSDVLVTREIRELTSKYPALSGPRLRMSISAADLIGKTHDELVLLLIQLRREYSALEKVKGLYRGQMEKKRTAEIAYRKMQQDAYQPIDPRLETEHKDYQEMKYQGDECEKKLEVYRPIINLVHNMVNMGSLYGGDNFMLASQYRKHLLSPEQISPPKKMIEFSRKHQEDQIVHNIKEEVNHLKRDQVDLEEKLERLYELDKLLQEQSFNVTALQEDKDLLEKALQGLMRQQDGRRDPYELDSIHKQQRTVEKELSRVLYKLAEASKKLEATSAENNKVEHEVALLRSKVHGELARSKSAPSLSDENYRKKVLMEKDLAKVKNMMAGLSEEGQRLSEAISTLRRSSSGGALNVANGDEKPRKKDKAGGTYMETDLDTTESKDLSQVKAILSQRSLTSVPDDMNISVGMATEPKLDDVFQSQTSQPLESMGFTPADGPWDISDADENTKRFYGIIPKERPKTLTVRDVKRQSEQRREREKIRKEIDDMESEDPSWASSTASPKQEHQPIYENLPPANSVPKPWSSLNTTGGSSSNNSSITPSRRTSSVHLIAPRPFIRSFPSPTAETSDLVPSKSFSLSNAFNDSGFVKATRVIVQPDDESKNSSTSPSSPPAQPLVKGWSPVRTNLFNVKRTPKGRYMTISSSEPVKMETSLLQPASLHSVAGDLITNNKLDMVPDIVKSSTTRVDIDDDALEREILAFPEKVEIPERYMPDSDDESVTEEEKYRRQEKSEKLKKILTNQSFSLHSVSQPDVSNVAQEKIRRAQILTMNQELARQVTKKSREAAAARRKTWSGSPGKVIVPSPDQSEVKEAEFADDIARYQRQENLYI